MVTVIEIAADAIRERDKLEDELATARKQLRNQAIVYGTRIDELEAALARMEENDASSE